MRNIIKAAQKVDRHELVKGLRAIYKTAHKEAAKAAFRMFRLRWMEKYPKLAAGLEEGMGSLLCFYEEPDLRRGYLRTTNPIERVFLDLRRRGFGCGAFANRRQAERIVFGVFLWLNRMWKCKDIWQERVRKAKRTKAAKLAA